MKPLISGQRRAARAALMESPLDVLVVGGGIVGAGVARDAAMRGLRVGLVEQHDFAFGASSRSSRLLHGGLRYLAQGRVGLVRNASLEKKIIHHIAPHLAKPLPFIFPTYRSNKNWVLWQLKIGVKIYDMLCGGQNLGKSTWLTDQETLHKVPGLSSEGLTGAVRYYDGFTNDARLVLDTLRSALKHGAILLNYSKFEGADFNSREWCCRICDKAGHAESGFYVRAYAVVNATGPWAGGLPHSRVKLRLTKGVHLVVNRSRLAAPDMDGNTLNRNVRDVSTPLRVVGPYSTSSPETVVMTDGKRIAFVIPWGERAIVGTTDTDYDGPLDNVWAEASDIDQVLKITNRFFPNAKLTERDVISSWAGLRPLIANANGSPSDISRSHAIRNPQPGWWDMAGGKLTTYRFMAEQIVDQIVKAMSKNSSRFMSAATAPCRTAIEPLLPRAETEGVSGLLPPQFDRDVVQHYCTNEWVVHLEDVMIRRAGWHYYFADAAEHAELVADWMGKFLDWPEETRVEEIGRYRALTAHKTSTQTQSLVESAHAVCL